MPSGLQKFRGGQLPGLPVPGCGAGGIDTKDELGVKGVGSWLEPRIYLLPDPPENII